MTVTDTLALWRDQGWLRALDAAFGRFIGELALAAHGHDDAVVLLAAALAHVEGRGHTCLPLAELAAQPGELLGWPVQGMQAWGDTVGSWWPDAGPQGLVHAWRQALGTSAVVDLDGQGDGHRPLVLHQDRLYLRRYWRLEQSVAAEVLARVARQVPVNEAVAAQELQRLFGQPGASGTAGSDQPDWQRAACAVALRAGLSIITGGPGTGKTYTVARLLALLFALAQGQGDLRVMLAAPTGKAAARLRQSIEQALDTIGPDLSRHIGPARTLHALLGVQPGTRRFRHHAAHPLEVDVLIVDEASMVHLEMMAALLDALPQGARVILLGDKDQLASVEAGAVLGDLCRDADKGLYDTATVAYVKRLTGQVIPSRYRLGATAERLAAPRVQPLQGDLFAPVHPLPGEHDDQGAEPACAASSPLAQQTVMLRQSRRFAGPIGQLAQAVNEGRATDVRRVFEQDTGGAVWAQWPALPPSVCQLALQGRAGAPASYRDYLLTLRQRPDGQDAAALQAWALDVLSAFDRFRVLCALREGDWGVTGLNQAIEDALARAGLLRRTGEWYEGRPVMITRNDPALGVFNGDVGVVMRWPRTGDDADANPVMKVFFKDGLQLRSVLASRLADVETAFVMTVHKSQGSEFEHTVLALPDDSRGVLTRELVYTGITRARAAFSLLAAHPASLDAAIARRTRRHSGLSAALSLPLSPES